MALSAEGRAPWARFRLEESQFHKADADEIVTIERFFLPYYTPRATRPFASDAGFSIHQGGLANPASVGLLFNNPFFKHQYARHKENGMPPASFGMG